MTTATWKRVVLVLIGALVLPLGCKLDAGKKFTWSSTIDTEYDIGDGEDRQVGYWHFDDPFELTPGNVALKFNYRVNQAGSALAPDTLGLHFRVYDSTFSQMKFEYQIDTAGKMKQAGCCAYKLSFKGADDFPGWNISAGDNLTWSVLPKGGSLPTGTSLGINYVYTTRR